MKNATKRLWAVFLCMAMLITAACGKDAAGGGSGQMTPEAALTQAPSAEPQATPTSEQAPTTEPEAMPTSELTPADTGKEPTVPEDAGEPYSVTLPDGTVLELAGTPQRIISMGPNITDMLFAIGAGDAVVGRTDYCDTPGQVADIPSVGTISKPDIEAILALMPDLVIGSTLFSEDTEKQLQDFGIPVAVLYDSENMDGVYDMIRTLGELTGRKEAGDALAAQAEQTVKDTIAKYSGAEYADFESPTVYYVVGFGEYGDYTAGGGTFIGQLITAAGGKNIAQDVDGWKIDHETLLEADPQIVIIAEGLAESFCTTPGYEGLSAVKNNVVVEFDIYHMLERQSHKNAEIFVQLAELFHTEPAQ